MKVAVITLSPEGTYLGDLLLESLEHATLYVHESAAEHKSATRFSRIIELTAEIFDAYQGLVFIAPCGVVVRAVGPMFRHKLQDPAVVVVDAGGRFAVSLLSGHEGGANELAVAVANVLGAEPVISTTTEALKDLIVGVGCKRGTESQRIVTAIREALDESGLQMEMVRYIASADIKGDEPGLLKAAQELEIPVRFIPSQEIRNSTREFQHSEFVASKVSLPAVAEPCALLAGRRTRLIVPKRKMNGVTVAIARESFLWSESDLEALSTEPDEPNKP